MKLTEFYPAPTELIANELKTLEVISRDPYFGELHSKFAADASTAYSQYKARGKGFRFESYIEVVHKGLPIIKTPDPKTLKPRSNVRLLIGGMIDQKKDLAFENISYYLAVCKLTYRVPPRIVRKLHFDITPPVAKRRQPQPVGHLQYCGELTRNMELGLRYKPEHLKHMHPELSEPRILYWPMSLGLLIDMALREFSESSSVQFRESSEWKNLLRRDETLILKRFHQKCVSIISDSDKKRPTIADSFYVKN